MSFVSVLFCQWVPYESFCTAKQCLVSACGPLHGGDRGDKVPRGHKGHESRTPKDLWARIQGLRTKGSYADSGAVTQAHLLTGLLTFLWVKVNKIGILCQPGHSLSSHLPALLLIYWSLWNFNKWFEESASSKAGTLLHIFAFSILSILHNSNFAYMCVRICVCVLTSEFIALCIYVILYITQKSCELMWSASAWKQNQYGTKGGGFSQKKPSLSLTSRFSTFAWVFRYITPVLSTPKMK